MRDSDWRRLQSVNSAASPGSAYRVRRTGSKVLIDLRGVTVSSLTRSIGNVASLPSGFRAPSDCVFLVDSSTGSVGQEVVINIFNGSTIYARTLPGNPDRSNVELDGVIEFTTFSSWPGTLPGTPA